MNNKTRQQIVKVLQELLKELGKKRIQMFDCEDIMGDYKIVLFSEEAVEVLYAPEYRYVEILGLPKEEYNYLFKKYGY